MSLYSEYIKELTNKEILENEKGFATYYINENTCYIEDIYVKPEYRHEGIGRKMANEIQIIAREKGCNKLYGTVIPTAKTSTTSLRLLIEYGFKLENALSNLIVLSKEIGE